MCYRGAGFVLLGCTVLFAAFVMPPVESGRRGVRLRSVAGGHSALSLHGSSLFGRQSRFEMNLGQLPGGTNFISRQGDVTLLFERDQVVVLGRAAKLAEGPLACARGSDSLPKCHTQPLSPDCDYPGFRLKLPHSNPGMHPEGSQPLLMRTHYFVGNDQSKWFRNVRTFSAVVYRDVYPGIDMVFHGMDQQLQYDFIVHRGASPQDIQLRFEHLGRGREISLGPEGEGLRIQCGRSVFHQHPPRLFQGKGGTSRQVAGKYRFIGRDSIGFEIGPYDHAEDLLIDPVLSYSTYLGGSSTDEGRAVAVDGSGNVYVTGYTASLDFPSLNGGVRYGSRVGFDVFVLKLNAAGAILYTAYLGGSSDEIGHGIAADNQGNAYVTGGTFSPDFPTLTPLQTYRGFEDAFVAKLNPDGSSLLFATFLGGTNKDEGTGIAVDSGGNISVTGGTYSVDFPRVNASQTNLGGSADAFVARLNAAGTQLLFSTYLGGGRDELASGIAADSSGNVVIAGSTFSSDFPLQNPLQSGFAGVSDGFLTKLNAQGALLFSTYFGGSGQDNFRAVALDASGNIFVTGSTFSADFPTTPGSFQPVWRGATDACVVKFNSTGNAVLYSTYLGGGGNELGLGIGVESNGTAWITGYTSSIDFPIVSGFQSRNGGMEDLFVTEMNSSGSAPLFSTYWGGVSTDYGFALAVEPGRSIYVTGFTFSTNYPVANALQAVFGGGNRDALLLKIDNPQPPRLRVRRRP